MILLELWHQGIALSGEQLTADNRVMPSENGSSWLHLASSQ